MACHFRVRSTTGRLVRILKIDARDDTVLKSTVGRFTKLAHKMTKLWKVLLVGPSKCEQGVKSAVGRLIQMSVLCALPRWYIHRNSENCEQGAESATGRFIKMTFLRDLPRWYIHRKSENSSKKV